MARQERGEPERKRFTRSGHTSHPGRTPGSLPPPPPAPYPPPVQYAPPLPAIAPPYPLVPTGPTGPTGPNGPHGPAANGGFGSATYHGDPARPAAPPSGGKVTRAARATASGTHRGARFVTRKVISASEANGARESGLTALIWNQVLSYGTDAMITVALASTVFFGASPHAQRGHVLLYLLVTMAPFAVVAPVIGPALDRVQHGRRWAMAGTAIGRAILAIIMAGHATDLLVLYPCALASLVLSKAYGVIRAAAAPRLVPPGMSLVEANARLSIFGLASALIGGGIVGGVIKLSGSYAAGLYVTAIAFAACGYFAFRLPAQVDSAQPAPRHPEEPDRPRTQVTVPPLNRLRMWAQRGFLPQVVTTLQGEAALRFMAGLLTIFMAFYVESTRHGVDAAVALGLLLGAAGVGNFIGTAIGARLAFHRPEVIVMVCISAAAVSCLLVAALYNLTAAVIGMLVSASANGLGKLALDAMVQRDVAETLRTSAFARSETFLQLTWVLGAALACLLPSKDGSLGFWVAGGVAGVVSVLVVLHYRAVGRSAAARRWPLPPGAPQ